MHEREEINSAEDFIKTAERLQEYGYEEVNLNLGCPSKTVVSKGRGSGFLAEPDRLNAFLEEIFNETPIDQIPVLSPDKML